jgi:hypothetical protein
MYQLEKLKTGLEYPQAEKEHCMKSIDILYE